MKRLTLPVALAVLFFGAAVPGWARPQVKHAQATTPSEVLTTFAFMVGSREGAAAPTTSVLVFPRTASMTEADMVNVAEELGSVQAKLKKSMNLSNLDLVSWNNARMRVGEEQTFQTPDGTLTLYITLKSVSGSTAIYDVRMAGGTGDPERSIPISVPLGGQFIIGRGLHGETKFGYVMVAAASGAPSGKAEAAVMHYSHALIDGKPGVTGGVVGGAAKGTSEVIAVTKGGGAGIGVGVAGGAATMTMKVETSDLIATPARITGRIKPDLTHLSPAGQSGTIVLEAKIGTDGLIHDARVVSGAEALGEAALAALKHWQFEPARDRDGNPVESTVAVTFTFKFLNDLSHQER